MRARLEEAVRYHTDVRPPPLLIQQYNYISKVKAIIFLHQLKIMPNIRQDSHNKVHCIFHDHNKA